MDVGIMIKSGENEIPYLGENNISDNINHDMNGKRKRKKKLFHLITTNIEQQTNYSKNCCIIQEYVIRTQ